MKSTKFIKTPLAASVAMILTAGLGTMSAYAQDEQEKADNDI